MTIVCDINIKMSSKKFNLIFCLQIGITVKIGKISVLNIDTRVLIL